MYIRTPQKYRRRRRRHIFPCGRILLLAVMTLLIVVGIGIYENIEMFRPYVDHVAATAMSGIERQSMTMAAPPPTATKDPAADLVSASNFWERGAVSEALRLYLPILDSVPNDVNVHYRVTLGLITQGDLERAVEIGERTVTANPFSSDAWAIRAWAYDWAGDYGTAIASALHARELDPKNARATAFLAEAYFAAGQTQRALTLSEDAIRLDPDSFEAYRARGYVNWYGLYDNASALTDFRTAYDIALETNPAAAGLIAVDIAGIEIGNQNIQGALQVLNGVLEVNPENTLALYWTGYVYLRQVGDPSQSNSYFLRCVDLDPENIDCYYMLGRSQMSLEQTAVAAESFARTIELGSETARHYWWAGNAQIALGNCSSALEYLHPGYALALDDGDTELVSNFEYLFSLCGVNMGGQPEVAPTPETTENDA